MEGNSTGYIGMANVSPSCGVSSTSPTVVVESSAGKLKFNLSNFWPHYEIF